MKMTKQRLVYLTLQVLFTAVVPLVIVFVGYGGWGEEANGFKIYFGCLIVLAVVLLVAKRVIFKPWAEKTRIKSGLLEADLEKETDTARIILIESALKRYRVCETVFNWALPLVCLAIVYAAFNAVEKELVQFTSILGWVVLSEIVGFAFSLLESLAVEGKHKPKQDTQQ